MSGAYYNEIDPFAAAWLRELIKAGHIAAGEVDERSILDVAAGDLRGFAQCHFFAGIGVWSYALRCAGWPDDRPVWTGSCPCQPLSSAGLGRGHADERHLWPAFHALIAECGPATVLGEQVASKDGREWFAAVRADLERSGYACGCADLAAAGVGAPHIRQRLFFVANADGPQPQVGEGDAGARRGGPVEPAGAGAAGAARGLADADTQRVRDRGRGGDAGAPEADAGEARQRQRLRPDAGPDGQDGTARPGEGDSFWHPADWLLCRDGRWRPVEPGTFPLASGTAARVGRLRGYGNALCAPVAKSFIEAVMLVR